MDDKLRVTVMMPPDKGFTGATSFEAETQTGRLPDADPSGFLMNVLSIWLAPGLSVSEL
jgi:hypothetical protein